MPETFQALGVLIVALLPGALYVWSFERLAGAWGIRLSDRLFRFVGVSAILHAFFAPVSFWFWRRFIRSGQLGGGHLPLWAWGVVVAYVALPIAAGTVIGWATRAGRFWAQFFTGPEPAPTAWDYLFRTGPDGWIRLKMKSGIWLGGVYARGESYTSGYPEPQDLFLVEAVEVDPESGEFILDEDEEPVPTGSGILVRWDEVEYLDFIEG